jgi:hypothetical protein
MKTLWTAVIVLMTCLILVAGCGKKEKPAPTPVEPSGQETGMMDTMKETAGDAAKETTEAAKEAVKETTEAAKETVEAVKESFMMDINLEKPIADLKAEAAKMDVAALTEVAKKYKDAIMEKQGALKSLTDKLAAIPMTEKMGTQAQGLTAEIKTLTESMVPLKERLGVYVDAIKAKGGDAAGLTM